MIVPLEEGGGVSVKVEAGLLGVVPLVAEDEHDPGVELCQRGGHVTLASLVEDRADQPQVERVAATQSITYYTLYLILFYINVAFLPVTNVQ